MSQSPFSAFGSNKPPKPVVYPWLRPLLKTSTALGTDAYGSLSRAGEEAERRFNEGTPQQEALQREQEGVLRGLLSKRTSYDPNQFLKDIGTTAFSFINPSVVDPLSRFDVNYDTIARRAAGLNPALVDSTADRLRRSRIASGRYYDVANRVYSLLPSLYTQAFNSGLASDEAAGSYIPRIMSGYRDVQMSPLIPANARAQSALTGANILGALSQGARGATYGFQQPKNIWDRLGELDSSLWDRLGEAINMVGSLYSGGMLGGIGGGAGGLMGGGGGGGGLPGGANSAVPKISFIPQSGYSPEFYERGPQ